MAICLALSAPAISSMSSRQILAHNSFTGSTDYYKDVDTLSAQLQLTPDEIRNPDGGSFF